MRKILFLTSLILLSFSAKAQNLLNSRYTSYYSYIYKLTDKEAKTIYKKHTSNLKPAYFHHLVDSFPTDSSYTNVLEQGHYLRVKIHKNKLIYEITTVKNFDVKILNNSTDLNIQVLDSFGGIISDAKVKIKQRKLHFDKKTQSYRIKKANKNGFVSVRWKGNIAYYELSKKQKNSKLKRIYSKIFWGTPIKYVWRPVNFIIRIPIDGVKSLIKWRPIGAIHQIIHPRNWIQRIRYRIEDKIENLKPKYEGYFVSSQPKYKPNDTVRFKAYILHGKKAVDDDLQVVLIKNNKTIVLDTISAYEKGAYEYEFVLSDSLNLTLDKSYKIAFKKNWRTLQSGYFKYEDYELAKNTFTFRSDKENQYAKKPFAVFIKGTDENDLNLLDASVELAITHSHTNKYFANTVFIPDTLWTQTQKLEPLGETKIMIHDSIFPAVNMEYRITATCFTSDREKIIKTLNIDYFHEKSEFLLKLNTDSVEFNFTENGKAKRIQANLESYNSKGKRLATKEIRLPYKEKLNQQIYNYKIVTDNLTRTLGIYSKKSALQCFTDRTADSLIILVENPRKIDFTYFIYRKNKEIARGFAKELNFRKKVVSKQKFFICLQYVWAGKVEEETYSISLNDKELNVVLTQPEIIFPGQTATIGIEVKDFKGKAVENVDLTAFALTKKFNYEAETLKNFTKQRKGKDFINSFSSREYNKKNVNNFNVNNFFRESYGVDSIEYFKFLYPKKSLYTSTYQTKDSITQITPFFIKNGKIQTVHIVYIDQIPRYFSWMTSKNPYSFAIDSGYHHIQLRTNDKMINLSKVYVPYRKKLVISISDSIDNENITITEEKYELSENEKYHLQNYILPIRYNFKNTFSYLGEDENVIQLKRTTYSKSTILTGPIFGSRVNFHKINNFDSYQVFERNFEYEFFPNILKMRSVNQAQLFNNNKWKYTKQTFRDKVLTEKEIHIKWQKYLNQMRRQKDYYNSNYLVPQNGKLEIELSDSIKKLSPLNILFFSYDDIPDLQVHKGRERYFRGLKNENYKIVFLLENNNYFVVDSVKVYQNGYNYLIINKIDTLLKDEYNDQIVSIIQERVIQWGNRTSIQADLDKITALFYRQTKQKTGYTLVSGKIIGNYKNPLSHVVVKVKGTEQSVVSNKNGIFEIYVKLPKIVEFSKSGYISQDTMIQNNKPIAINLKLKKENYNFQGLVSGVVSDETGTPMPGVTIFIKDAPEIGTISNFDGKYELKANSNSILVFQFIGMESKTEAVYNRNKLNVVLNYQEMGLDEVVITALGVSREKKMMAYSVSDALSGKVAGLQLNLLSGQPGSSSNIRLRGLRSIDESNEPMYLVDGMMLMSLSIEDLNSMDVMTSSILKPEEATALYGSKAANGAIIITTKDGKGGVYAKKIGGKSINQEFDLDYIAANSSNSIRSNFSDYAFWKPKLRTDKNGKASFKVKFPDDVTNWKTFVLAMNSKKQTGQTKGEIKSYKPLMAQVALPRFLVRGDTALAIGKTLNYTYDSIPLNISYEKNDRLIFSKKAICVNSIIDTLSVTATNTDSLKVKYYLETEKDYFDGEERKIPVFEQGMKETHGNFFVLEGDTTLTLNLDYLSGEVKLSAISSSLEIILDEIKHVKNYKYLCNEQLASKLKVLLWEERIFELQNKEFKQEKEIKKIIKKLTKNQNNKGQWGWWNNSTTVFWVSNQALEALLQAQEQNYKVEIKKQLISNNLVRVLTSTDTLQKIRSLKLLKKLDIQVDYKKYVNEIEAFLQKDSINRNSLYRKVDLIELKQEFKLPYSIDSLLNLKHETLFGNYYWGEKSNYNNIINNSISTTLKVYKILQKHNYDDKYLQKIRNFLLEERSGGYWRNTYESANIIETIVPDILQKQKNDTIKTNERTVSKLKKSTITLSGSKNKKIELFPYFTSFSSDSSITITKTGDFPVYLSTFQQNWNKKPIAKSDYFEVETSLQGNKNKTLSLKAGENITLNVKIKVKKKADYVMIEVPIPAGCSYGDKRNTNYNEIHREYFKNYTSIFCQSLKQGEYNFTINLLPRYSGTYTINPAKAELMYFPVFYGNNEIKKVVIE